MTSPSWINVSRSFKRGHHSCRGLGTKRETWNPNRVLKGLILLIARRNRDSIHLPFRWKGILKYASAKDGMPARKTNSITMYCILACMNILHAMKKIGQNINEFKRRIFYSQKSNTRSQISNKNMSTKIFFLSSDESYISSIHVRAGINLHQHNI